MSRRELAALTGNGLQGQLGLPPPAQDHLLATPQGSTRAASRRLAFPRPSQDPSPVHPGPSGLQLHVLNMANDPTPKELMDYKKTVKECSALGEQGTEPDAFINDVNDILQDLPDLEDKWKIKIVASRFTKEARRRWVNIPEADRPSTLDDLWAWIRNKSGADPTFQMTKDMRFLQTTKQTTSVAKLIQEVRPAQERLAANPKAAEQGVNLLLIITWFINSLKGPIATELRRRRQRTPADFDTLAAAHEAALHEDVVQFTAEGPPSGPTRPPGKTPRTTPQRPPVPTDIAAMVQQQVAQALAAMGHPAAPPSPALTNKTPTADELRIMGYTAVQAGRFPGKLTEEGRALCNKFGACLKCRNPFQPHLKEQCTHQFPARPTPMAPLEADAQSEGSAAEDPLNI